MKRIYIEEERINDLRAGLRALGWINSENEQFITDEGLVDSALGLAISKIKEWIKEKK